jgi:hypothetical protein
MSFLEKREGEKKNDIQAQVETPIFFEIVFRLDWFLLSSFFLSSFPSRYAVTVMLGYKAEQRGRPDPLAVREVAVSEQEVLRRETFLVPALKEARRWMK